ncbi:hypothetical protein VA596_17070 [Amycolatopsis sp., V23-08]|uniref:Uncharacterized protein n=1 Tax=Amycolatopsis heterodermiae TaxID=3110235 RepID=A0ABU5R636_9PSEU|nr:hypothetical protein [Amycolatopsis sp., V23-08]MEA5361259.1 hypothetical protein [Amycolatopsis sp., V23-08]
MTLRFLITTVARTAEARADRARDDRETAEPPPQPDTPEGAPR